MLAAIVALTVLLAAAAVLLIGARRQIAGLRMDLVAERDFVELLLAIEDAGEQEYGAKHRLVEQ